METTPVGLVLRRDGSGRLTGQILAILILFIVGVCFWVDDKDFGT